MALDTLCLTIVAVVSNCNAFCSTNNMLCSFLPLYHPHQDTSINGYHLPKGTSVNVNFYGMHHDEDFWDEPFAFKPERFIDEEGKLVPGN